MKVLKYSNLQIQPGPPGARALLTVKFLDEAGEVYSWTPRWADTEQLFLKAINIESFNKPESEWLPRFSKTVKEAAEGTNQPIQEAFKVSGILSEVSGGKLLLTEHDGYEAIDKHSLTPLFAVTFEFLDTWLNQQVQTLVINGVPVYVRDENGNRYPEPQANLGEVDDLPF